MPNILLLETDKLIAKSIVRQLEILGCSVDWQVDPQEAIISVDLRPVELVIMDVTLAGRSGVEFLYEFRSYPDWVNIPVFIYSSVPPRELGSAAAGFNQMGVKGYFYKPTLSPRQLADKIELALKTKAV